MRKTFRIFYLLLWFSFAQAQTEPVIPQLTFSKISVEDGLSNNVLTCVLKDSKNRVWVGGSIGLNVLNGSEIVVYKHHPADSSSLCNDHIYCLLEDYNGNIWIGTNDGLCKYSDLTQKFKTCPVPESKYGAPQTVFSMCMGVDSTIWMGTGGGLIKLDLRDEKMTLYQVANDDVEQSNPVRANHIEKVMFDSKHILWLCTGDGVWTYHTENHQFFQAVNKHNDKNFDPLYLGIAEDKAQNMWISGWKKGLKKWDRATGTVADYSQIANAPPYVNLVNGNQPAGGNDFFWVGDKIFSPQTGKYDNFTLSADAENQPNIISVYVSNDGWYWFATDQGLYISNPEKTVFKHHIFHRYGSRKSLLVIEWGDNLLIGGAGDNLLRLYDKKLQPIHVFFRNSNYSGKPYFKDAAFVDYTFDEQGALWAGTSEGLFTMDRNGIITDWFRQDNAKNGLPGNFITTLLHTSENEIWVFPWREGIWKFDKTTRSFNQVFKGFIREESDVKKLVVGYAVEDDARNIWMADLWEGIVLYNRKNNEFQKPFVKQIGDRNTLAARMMYVQGWVYANIDNRIFKFKSADTIDNIITLPENMDCKVHDFAVDKNENIWMATDRGLVRYDQKSNDFFRFTKTDGLLSNMMNGNLFCASDNTVYFAGDSIVTWFNPADLAQIFSPIPPVGLTGFFVNGISQPIDLNRIEKFQHTSNSIFMKWNIPDFNNPLRNQYYYKIKGIDKAWKYVGNKGELQLVALSSGNYSIELTGANSNGVFSQKPITIRFTILSARWKQWWAIILYVAALAAVFYALYRFRLNKLNALSKLRINIAADLHDDIGSTLSSISILSEIASRESGLEKKQEILSDIKHNSHDLLDKMGDIVWSIFPTNDSLEDLLIRIRVFASKLFEAKGIEYNIEMDKNLEGVKLSIEYRRHIYLILKEVINNIIKHSKATEAEIKVSFSHRLLRISIEDNGVGFDTQNSKTGNGMTTLQQRAEKIVGDLEIISRTGEGTKFILLVKV